MPLNFTAIDFETANEHSASACAVGLAKVVGGKVVDRVSWLIRPTAPFDYFLPINISIHGIKPGEVESADTWHSQLPRMLEYIDNDPVVAHNAGFDMAVYTRSSQAAAIEAPQLEYACSVLIAKKVFLGLESYSLAKLSNSLGLPDFHHHDPAEDAEASANIVNLAARRSGAASLSELIEFTGLKIKQTAVESAGFGQHAFEPPSYDRTENIRVSG